MRIKLVDFTQGNDFLYGSIAGRKTYYALKEYVEQHSNEHLFVISFEEITAIDSTFLRESVMALVEDYKCKKFFVVENKQNRISSNWDCAARAKNVAVTVLNGGEVDYIGEPLTTAARELLGYVNLKGSTFTSNVASDMGISVQSAGVRLKKLADDGLLIRKEQVALSGGKEFSYSSFIHAGEALC